MSKPAYIKQEHKRNGGQQQSTHTFRTELTALVAASHWSLCFLYRAMVPSSARASSSMRFSLTKSSCTPPSTASTR